MEFVRAEIENFRSIDKLTLDFRHGCQALIGINESGKSNILRALHLLDTSSTPAPGDLRIERHEEDQVTSGYVRFVFRLTNEEVAEVIAHVKARFSVHSADAPLIARGASTLTLADWIASRPEGIYTIALPGGARTATTWSVSSDDKLCEGWYLNKTSAAVQLEREGVEPYLIPEKRESAPVSVPAQGLVYLTTGKDAPDATFERATVKVLQSLLLSFT
jgi:hypothetical protein